MAAMLVLVCIFMLMMKSNAAHADILSVRSGEAILLRSNLTEWRLQHLQDVRWTHQHLVMSLSQNTTMCYHKRCELLRDGSLSFSHVRTQDSGNYRLQVFDKFGKRVKSKDFMLRVNDAKSSNSVLVSVLISCFLLLFIIIIISIITIFIFKRKRGQTTAPGMVLENTYVTMNQAQNKKEEESYYVPCKPAVSTETPVTQQESAVVEDVYELSFH